MKVVKVFNNRPEAEMFASLLLENNIQCMVQADDCGGIRPYMAISGGVKLVTNDEDHEAAVRIFEEMKGK